MSDTDPMPKIRKFSPETLHPTSQYSHLVEVSGGRTVYISGQIALDVQGNLIGPGDMGLQARQVFENIQTALQSVGLTFASVVKLNYYVTDISQIAAVRTARDAFLGGDGLPASTAVQVARLFRDDLLIEVEAIAVAP
jgi:enamine deaminase RidA (YjgF/YER057c/UK114 family)